MADRRAALAGVLLTACAAVACGPAGGSESAPAADRALGTPSAAPTPAFVAALGRNPRARASVVRTTTWGEVGGPATITATVLTYEDWAGALAGLNGWVAALGSLPAADRTSLAIGDEAVRYDLGWPSWHVLAARRGPHVVIVEGGDALPADRRATRLEEVAGRLLAP